MVLIVHLVGLKNSLSTSKRVPETLKVCSSWYPYCRYSVLSSSSKCSSNSQLSHTCFLAHGTNSSFFQEPMCLLLSYCYNKLPKRKHHEERALFQLIFQSEDPVRHGSESMTAESEATLPTVCSQEAEKDKYW